FASMRTAGRQARAALGAACLLLAAACSVAGVAQQTPTVRPTETVVSGPTPRPRADIPEDWPAGKRIVMQVTPSLNESYTVACDLPVPALTYLSRGQHVTILIDSSAVTAFRRDAA